MAHNNYRIESKRFFNAQTSQNNRAWADAAAAYFRQVGQSTETNFVDAMAKYYAKINAGALPAPVNLSPTQAVVANNGTTTVKNSANTNISTAATYTVAANTVTGIKLPATVAGVSNTGSVTVPITFTTARTAGQQATVAATFTVAAGVITAIVIA